MRRTYPCDALLLRGFSSCLFLSLFLLITGRFSPIQAAIQTAGSSPTQTPFATSTSSAKNIDHLYDASELQHDDDILSIREKIINSVLKNYKSIERPDIGRSTIVRVNMLILAIFSIDVRTMDYNIDAYLRQEWTDRRLAWDPSEFQGYNLSIVSPKLKESLWLPDLFFRNGKEGYLHQMTLPNYLIRLKPNGDILYSQKITMKFSCQMYLHTFPMDTQKCQINIGSYAYTSSELKFIWRETEPLEAAKDLQIAEFQTPRQFNDSDCTKGYSTTTGRYSCLLVTFSLKRQIGYYLATTYIPNTLIIIVSWLSFWVNVDAAPARVPLGLLSLLGILTQAASVSSTLPRVSYIKAIDIWLIFSIVFVIGVLVEYAIALTVIRARKNHSWERDVRKIVHEELNQYCTACPQDQALAVAKKAQSLGLDPEIGFEGLIEHQVGSALESKESRASQKPAEC